MLKKNPTGKETTYLLFNMFVDLCSQAGNGFPSPPPAVPDASASVFFARCPPSITEDQLLEVFGKFGTVVNVNLFKRWAAAKSSKGCGIISFRETASAEAALVLNGQHKFTDSEVPMVVEPCQADRQRAPATGDLGSCSMHCRCTHSSCTHEWRRASCMRLPMRLPTAAQLQVVPQCLVATSASVF